MTKHLANNGIRQCRKSRHLKNATQFGASGEVDLAKHIWLVGAVTQLKLVIFLLAFYWFFLLVYFSLLNLQELILCKVTNIYK